MSLQVQSPVIGYVLTTTIKSPHGPEKAHMAYVFRRAMHYCSYSKLTDWSVSANNMPVVVQTLEGALKEYSKSRPGFFLGSGPTIPGTGIYVYSVLHEACENLLLGARNLILEKSNWDDSYNRKNAFTASNGVDMCVHFFKHGTTELRLTAIRLLASVIATPSSQYHSQRLQVVRSSVDIQATLTKLAKSADDSDDTKATAAEILELL